MLHWGVITLKVKFKNYFWKFGTSCQNLFVSAGEKGKLTLNVYNKSKITAETECIRSKTSSPYLVIHIMTRTALRILNLFTRVWNGK